METDFVPFDWRRIFIGDAPPLFFAEVVFRTAFLYLAAILLMRFMGKRGMSSLSPFEQVILIALGSAVGDPMFYPEVPLLYAVLVMAVIMVMHRGIATAIQRWDEVQDFVEGEPALLVADGRLLEDRLQEVQLNEADVYEALRMSGVEYLEEVRRAYLEVGGTVSVYKFEDRPKGRTSIMPENRQALMSQNDGSAE